jgi:gliding motility-associated-like protein
MQIQSRLLLSILLFVLSQTSRAQLFSGSADTVHTTEYKISGRPDSIYIFTGGNPNKTITAKSPNGGSATFEWSYYVPGSGYTVPTVITGTSSQIDTITSDLGYQVVITEGVNKITNRCWVFVASDFSVTITSTINDTISKNDIRCGFIKTLDAKIEDKKYTYYNPSSGQSIIYNPLKIQWKSNQKEAENPFPQHSLHASVDEPYWKDTWYIISVINTDTKIEQKDSAFYKSIEPHALFGNGEKPAEYIRLNDSAYYPGRTERYYNEIYGDTYYSGEIQSSPAMFRFVNSSLNADEFTWSFGDSIKSTTFDTISLLHTYQLPGSYDVFLIAKKNVDFLYDPCYDTFPSPSAAKMTIKVTPVKSIDSTKVPNVFTPPNGPYKYWRFKNDISITEFEISIYNRYGKKVYHFKGNIRDWNGWDGFNKETSKTVSTGVYYYAVKTIKPLPDFQTGEITDPLTLVSKGFIHVYNTEGQ